MKFDESDISNLRKTGMSEVLVKMKISIAEYEELVTRLEMTPLDSNEFDGIMKEINIVQARLNRLMAT